jgi:nitroreductase
MDLDKVIKSRHSVRSFKSSKKPSYKDILEIVNAGRYAPLAGNMPCLKYIVVQDSKKIIELSEAAQQPFFAEVSFAIVVCSDKKLLQRSFYDFAEIYSRQQAGATIENMLLKVTEMGLASCWVGAFDANHIRRILKIPDDVHVEAILPIGYEQGKSKRREKLDINSLVFFDNYGNKWMTPASATSSHNV